MADEIEVKPKLFVQRAAAIEKMARDGQFDKKSLARIAAMMQEVDASIDEQGVLRSGANENVVYLRRGKALYQAIVDANSGKERKLDD